MRFIDLFAGIGGFRKGMELAGHKCVGFCESDKFAVASYTSMHLLTDQQREKLKEIPMKKRQKEILNDEYRNGEWYASDIKGVNAGDLPEADCWCFGAPCQDFSIAGKRAGLDGDRSSLIREIFRLLEEQKEEDRPEWLIYENVKGMLSSNRGLDYLSILSELDRLGYDIEWQNINSKWFVPQNRERIYTIGHLRRFGRRKVFPITGADGENSVSIIGHREGYRRNMQTYGQNEITEALDTAQGGGRGTYVAIPIECSRKDGIVKKTDVSNTLMARDYKGIGNQVVTAIAIPIITPDRVEKRQNGRRFKENGEPMFTLTAQDRHGVGINISGHNVIGITDTCNCLNANDQRKVFGAKQERTLAGTLIEIDNNESIKSHKGIYVQLSNEVICYCVWYEKEQCYITIRKLTPKECFRLQGWTDDYFEKAAFINSDSQLYKQAGNGVTVDVIQAIGEKMK